MWGGSGNWSIFKHADKYNLYKGTEKEYSTSWQNVKSFWQNEDTADIRPPMYVEFG